jgi:hypothetical protein
MIAAVLVYRRNLQVEHTRRDVPRHFQVTVAIAATGRVAVVP